MRTTTDDVKVNEKGRKEGVKMKTGKKKYIKKQESNKKKTKKLLLEGE